MATRLDRERTASAGQELRLAVIGCGALAQSQHLPHIAHSPRMVLHTCCDVSDETLGRCVAEFRPVRTSKDFRQAIADPEVDAVCIATTEKVRLPLIRAAAEAGKPVYCEKPIARTLAETYEIQRIVKRSGIPFCLGHNRRSAPAMIDARRIFRSHMTHPKPCPWRWEREGPSRPHLPDDGIAAMNVRINDDWHSWKSWVFDDEQSPHGPLIFEMTHFTDLCNWFLAAEPQEVVAMETGMLNHSVIVRYRTGELATISMSGNGSFGYPKELYEMMGNGGVVVIEHMLEVRTAGIADAPARTVYAMVNDRHPHIGSEGGVAGWLVKKRAACDEAAAKGNPLLQFTAEPDKGHSRALEAFVDEVLGIGPAVCGIDDAMQATRVAFAALKSVHERRIVAMDEI